MNQTAYTKKKYLLAIVIFSVLLVLLAMISLSWGTYQMDFSSIIKTFLGNGSKMENTVIFRLRLPRIVAAITVAVALSACSSILQSVTKNDLADSGIIGINSGAALFVVLQIVTSGLNYTNDLGPYAMYVLPIISILGAFLAGFLVYGLAYKKGVKPMRLILIGIGVNAGLNAIITYLQFTASQGDFNQVLTWTNGSLWGSSWKYLKVATPVIVILYFFALRKAKTIDILDLGDDMATGLGIKVERERRLLLLLSVALAGVTTAIAGNISFLGLLSAHIAKRISGPKHVKQLPLAALVSCIIAVFADAISRNLFSPIEIPIGITISFIGVPYFIYLMMKQK